MPCTCAITGHTSLPAKHSTWWHNSCSYVQSVTTCQTIANESQATCFFPLKTRYLARVIPTSASPGYNYTRWPAGTSQLKLPARHHWLTSRWICQCRSFISSQQLLSNDIRNCTSYPARATNKLLLKDSTPTSTHTVTNLSSSQSSGSQDEGSDKDSGSLQMSSTSRSPEGEHTPSRHSRNSRSPRIRNKQHFRCTRHTKVHSKTISPPSHHSSTVCEHHKQGTYHHNHNHSPSSSDSSSSSSQGSSRSRSSSSTTSSSTSASPSPIRRRRTHYRCSGHSHPYKPPLLRQWSALKCDKSSWPPLLKW